MTAGTRTLQPADGEGLDVDRVVAALGRRFTVEPGSRRAVTRTHVDTFDRRLRAAGLALEHDVTARRQALVLTRADGPGATAPATGLRWPAFPDALPDGVLRQTVAAPAGIRALTAIGQEKRRLQLLELRNADDKVVVRVELDEPDESAPARPPTVTVRELRGYADEATRAVKALVATGLRPAPDRIAVDDDQGRTPVADRRQPAHVLLAAALGGFATALDDNLPGLLDDVDTEFLHDFRVAVRRTRATLKIGRPALPAPDAQPSGNPRSSGWGTSRRRCATSTSTSSSCPRWASWLVAADAADLAAFATHLRRRRTAARRALVRGLRSQRYRRLRADWDLALDRLGDDDRGSGLTAAGAGRPGDPPGGPAGGPRRQVGVGRLASHRPARPAQAVQGAALRAGGVRPRGRHRHRGRRSSATSRTSRTCSAGSRTPRSSAGPCAASRRR